MFYLVNLVIDSDHLCSVNLFYHDILYYLLFSILYIIYYVANLVQIGIHYGGIFYEFVPWNGFVNWEVATWGYWFMSADNGRYVVIIPTQTVKVLHLISI